MTGVKRRKTCCQYQARENHVLFPLSRAGNHVTSVKRGKAYSWWQVRETRISHVVIGPAQLTVPIGQKDVCTEYFNLDAGQHFFNQLNVKLFSD